MKANAFAFALGAAALTAALPTRADIIDFTGLFDPSEWTTTILGDVVGGSNGGVTHTAVDLSITGGDGPSPDPSIGAPACTGFTNAMLFGPCEVRSTRTSLPSQFALTFSYDYVSSDVAGAGSDLFGYLVNGVRTNLVDPGGPSHQSGTVTVAAGQSFGWFVNCRDCIAGAATVRITAFQARAIPEPPALGLLSLGLVGLLAARWIGVGKSATRA